MIDPVDEPAMRSANEPEARPTHIAALDGVRGAAVLGILFFHAGHLRGGWLGVDLFFVLSGFLITSLLLDEFAREGRISLAAFWTRRARRLFPALLLTLLGVAGYAAFFAEGGDLPGIRADGLATLFYVANWNAILAEHDYWELFRAASPLDHTWSLAIEEQFYLIWPPLVVLALSWSRSRAAAVAGLASLIALLSSIWMGWLFDPEAGTARVYFGTDTRVAAPLVGAALAAFRQRETARSGAGSSRLADGVALAAMLALGAAWFTLDGTSPLFYRGGALALAVTAAILIGAVIDAPAGLSARLLEFAPLRYLGTISYGVYLWHWPLYLVLTPERTSLEDAPLTALRIALSLGVASLSFHFVEHPIRRGSLRPRSLAWAGAASSMLVLVCLWAATDPGAQKDATRIAADPVRVAISQGDEPTLLLIGDSVGETLGPALQAGSERRGLVLIARGHLGCILLENRGIRFPSGLTMKLPECASVREGWRQYVEEARPDAVLILEGGTGLGARNIDGEWLSACDVSHDAAFERDLGDAVRFFSERGARTFIVTGPPPSLEDVSGSFLRLWQGARGSALEERLARSLQCMNVVRERVATERGASLIDLRELICPGGRCQREIDGAVLRPDGVHFDGPGAEIVSDWLLERVLVEGIRAEGAAPAAPGGASNTSRPGASSALQ